MCEAKSGINENIRCSKLSMDLSCSNPNLSMVPIINFSSNILIIEDGFPSKSINKELSKIKIANIRNPSFPIKNVEFDIMLIDEYGCLIAKVTTTTESKIIP